MGMIIQNGVLYSGNAERGYREHTLWDGPATPSISGTLITLTDSISEYDEIVFEIDKGNYDYSGQSRFNVSLLTVGDTYIDTVYTGSYQGAFWTYTSDTSITIKAQSTSSMQTYNRIIGIKYSEVVAGTSFHKYSTTERVVGEWIDGSAIYEKTFNLQSEISLDTANWTSLGVSLSGVGTPISVEARSARGANSAIVVDLFDSPMTAKGLDKVKSLTLRYTKSSS